MISHSYQADELKFERIKSLKNKSPNDDAFSGLLSFSVKPSCCIVSDESECNSSVFEHFYDSSICPSGITILTRHSLTMTESNSQLLGKSGAMQGRGGVPV